MLGYPTVSGNGAPGSAWWDSHRIIGEGPNPVAYEESEIFGGFPTFPPPQLTPRFRVVAM